MYSANTINTTEKLVCGDVYHVYNKAVGSELLFRTSLDYEYFLKKMSRFILPIANIYAYCLIPNHFHVLLKLKQSEEIPQLSKIDEERYPEFLLTTFGNFFNSYSKSYNKKYERHGRLFVQPFKRKSVEDDDYFIVLVNYIHRNPLHHGLVKHYGLWKYSSYSAYLIESPSQLSRKEVLDYFKSPTEFIDYHEENRVKPGMEALYLE